ncbi:G1 family glutamic endopeptidase [Streptomyces sp. 4F14]|uniref:G1 family glutamic endopeptidase n=1 Tax=Streptomyces sp. 4F14 TaxID=3394380 RepID=UPI003A87870E
MRTKRRLAVLGSLSCSALMVTGPAFAEAAACTAPQGNWTGFQLDGAHTSVSARWKVPTADCTTATGNPDGLTDQWIGFGSGDSWKDPLNQLGTSVQCTGGKASYYAWWEQFPANYVPAKRAVGPGDVIQASIKTAKNSQDYEMYLKNVTRNWWQTVHVTGPPTGTQVEVVTEIHDWGAAVTDGVRYDNVLVDGKPFTNFSKAYYLYSAQFGGVCVNTTTSGTSTLLTPTKKTQLRAVARDAVIHPG